MLNVQLDTIRAELSSGRGLATNTWDFVTANVDAIAPHLAPTERMQLAEAAFLACHYATARSLNITRPILAGQAAIYLRDETWLNEILTAQTKQNENKNGHEPANIEALLIIGALEIMKLRLFGEHSRAIEVFEQRLLPVLESNTVERDLTAHVYLIAGSPYFHANKYSTARALYLKAAEIFESAGDENLAGGFAAISAYNLVVSCDYLDLKFEARSWRERCQKHLERYRVPGLNNTLDLCTLQVMVTEKKYEESMEYGNTYLTRTTLTDVQRLTALVAVAEASVECGFSVRGQFRLNQAQQLVTNKKMSQFSPFCEVLEQEIANFTYRQRPIVSTRAKDQRATLVSKISRARQLVTAGRPTQALEVLTEIENEFPQSLLRRTDFNDLEIILRGATPSFLGLTPRAFWAMALRCIDTRDFDVLQELLSSNVTSETAFHVLARDFARGAIDMQRTHSQPQALKHFQDAFERAHEEGLERITSLALGCLAALDSNYQAEWQGRLDSLTENDRENLRQALHRLTKDENSRSAETAKTAGSSLVIDESAGVISYNGKDLDLQAQSIVFRVVAAIAKSGTRGLSKYEILAQVWGYEYSPLQHDSLIYVTINRLRELIPIELQGGQYRLPREVHRQIAAKRDVARLDEREHQVLNLLSGPYADGVQRLDVVKKLGISARTALRILNGLVHKKYLIRIGQGRGVVYAHAKGAIA